ncbi:5-methyltetrahydropteroyltriglutamate--homocysteine S-methyltransferase [Hamadaea tsunoensis]|uniref:5-methyltetrahydropteroyltriglutamate-- homocysteine S-methyltransferase n=1 Tax=Hamadaea tsunoensis TaxID=53368 RepID=UPI000413666C|nr:5-methyltetrahydropteroyltriglutamate--homocysteine S-methyltransferase [Hamadaea tsunoensis]
MYGSTVLGYPRIGARREIKQALEAYWSGRTARDALLAAGRDERRRTWLRLAELGLTAPPSNTFSFYDQVLDTAVLVGAVPERFRGLDPLDAYFAMARGNGTLAPLRMTKWFDTNYHYIVPELDEDTPFVLHPDKPLSEWVEARDLGLDTRPVLLGPVTFLLLAKGSPLHRLPELLSVYADLLGLLAAAGVRWVQFDEPALAGDRTAEEITAAQEAYAVLGGVADRPRIVVAGYFGELREALPALARTPIEGLALDLVRGDLPADLEPLRGKTIFAGVVSGRDVWRTDPAVAATLARLAEVGEVVVSSSCSLQHVPYDLDLEPDLDPELRDRLAFAEQKVAEIVALSRGVALPPVVSAPPSVPSPFVPPVRSPYPVRAAAQAARLQLPPVPTTTIGSFPQTDDVRRARAGLAAGHLSADAYTQRIRAAIARAVHVQEDLGLDVLVHGEPERNDMVQYFAENLDGFAVTRNGWVQSYGSRCTRPPIIHADVRRPKPITLDWISYAQSLTAKPVKGMLTGPVTIVAWSFVRRDLPVRAVVEQVARALRAEVDDLVRAGAAVIQVDEPALRELLPLRVSEQDAYLAWAVDAYRYATGGVPDDVQIHTHLCYSQVEDILAAVEMLDADVTTVESARSGDVVLSAASSFSRGLGPGVYDIHSPRVPGVAEITARLSKAVAGLGGDRAWANPDCGLKTRTYAEVEAALGNLVAAARHIRTTLS